MVDTWGVDAGFGGQIWSRRPLRRAYGSKSPSPRAPPTARALGRGFWIRMPVGGASETRSDRQNRPRPPTSPPKYRWLSTGSKALLGSIIRQQHVKSWWMGLPSPELVKGPRLGGSRICGGYMGCDAGLGGPIRFRRLLRRPYGTKSLSPRAAAGEGLGWRFLGPYAREKGLRDRTGPPKPASTHHVAALIYLAPHRLGSSIG
jgi:hypothetical protein